MSEGRRIKLPLKSTTMAEPTLKKVQVVYYLSKKGQLEHPHVLEVTHFVHHHLRLKDVLDRLTVLRGRGMPSLYSWSCKRMYKNGYVWNDLGENDVICPSEGDEYILKASQLVHHSLDKHESQMAIPKRRQMTPKRHAQFNEQELGFEEKRINYPNTHIDILPKPTIVTTPSPPMKRFEDDEPYPPLSRNLVLLQLMACGGSIGFKGKAADHHHHSQPPNTAARKSSYSSSSLHKDVLCKGATVAVPVDDEIRCMSENPRFGNLQADEREYFSGSIVDTMTEERVQVEPMLNKSSSYKEQRVSKATMSMVEDEVEVRREKAVAGKCLPKRFC